MKVLVGLGNPGLEYEKTRHNVGFMVIDILADKHKGKIVRYNFQSLVGKIQVNQQEVTLVKPLTYMNLVGAAVKEMMVGLRLELKDILIINDDADLQLGRIKICKQAGDAGHLGVRSIITSLGSKEFARLRIGIGRPSQEKELSEYVLKEFDTAEWSFMQTVFSDAVRIAETFVFEGIEKAMLTSN